MVKRLKMDWSHSPQIEIAFKADQLFTPAKITRRQEEEWEFEMKFSHFESKEGKLFGDFPPISGVAGRAVN